MKDTFDEDNDTDDEESSESDDDAKISNMVDALKDLMTENASKKFIRQISKGGSLKFFVT